MKLVEQSHEIIYCSENVNQLIELAGRTCYKSEDKITPDSAYKFVQMLIRRGHHAMIEFADIQVRFITNRGVTHELVRHRLCSFAQESTRYVNYSSDHIEFIKPVWLFLNPGLYDSRTTYEMPRDEFFFMLSCIKAEENYKELLRYGWRPEQAREVLPNALKTEIVVKANVREWRHIFKLRCSKHAHPQMRALMIPLLGECKRMVPIIFDDINPEEL